MEVMLIYSGCVAARWAVGSAPGYVPLAGGVVISFIDVYFYLAVACLLGLEQFSFGWDQVAAVSKPATNIF
jgi:hypothetical protein